MILLALFTALSVCATYWGDVNKDNKVTMSDLAELVDALKNNSVSDYMLKVADFDNDNAITIADVEALAEEILRGQLREIDESEDVSIIYVNFSGDPNAEVLVPKRWQSYVTVTTDGHHVSIANTNTEEEYTVSISGTTLDGSVTYTGDYKATFILNGANITNSSGAAIDIECSKRIALEIAEGTENSLTDGAGSQKAALYCKGHLEVSKGGSLTVSGNTKHAISTKEYLLLKKTVGDITITSAGSGGDGIHAGQYFQMNGGNIIIKGVTGDGIQAEATSKATDELNGQMIIKGGQLDITTTATDVAALKSDAEMTISDGTLKLTTSGAADKALKSKTDITISGGTLTTLQSGTYTVEKLTDASGNETYDPSYVTALKADNITISGGKLTLSNTADGGKAISADTDVTISNDADITITANGAGGVLDTSRATDGGSVETPEDPKSYIFHLVLPASATSSSQWGGPNGQSSTTFTWSNVALYTSSGTKVADLTLQKSVGSSDGKTTTTFYYYDFGEATSGSYYVQASYSATVSSNRPGGSSTTTTGTFKSSNLTLNLSGTDVYYSVTATSSSSGGGGGWPGSSSSTTLTFTTNDVTSSYSGGTTATTEGDTFSAACVKSDGTVNLLGGKLSMIHSGTTSKGIKADGLVTLDGTTVTDVPAGTYLIVGTDPAYCTAIKCGSFVGNSGSVTVNGGLLTMGAASRGISSDGTLVINGGTYDITLSGDGSTYTGNGTSEGVASVGLKSDGNMQLLGGSITINASAKGAKGIKVGSSSVTGANGATLTIGNKGADNSLLTLDVNTSGSYLATESGSSGGMGGPGGGGMDSGFIGSTKAIKVCGAVTVNSGNIHLSTKTDGAEGLESKYTITFNGGVFEADTYDDGINASTKITVNDGYIWSHASGNDGIDCNGSSGFEFNGGVTLASGTRSPEEGFDCDNYSFVINGGVLIGTGGATSSVTSCSTKYGYGSSVTVSGNNYLTLTDSNGNTFSYKAPALSGAKVLVSCPNMSTLKNGTTASSPALSLWDGVFVQNATISGGSSVSLSTSGGGGF